MESSVCSLDNLLSLFAENFSVKQITTVYNYSGKEFEESMECLGNGASLDSIMKMVNKQYSRSPPVKVHVDADEMWSDLLSFYKCTTAHGLDRRVRVCLDGAPPIDTGGVRRQVFTTVFSEFADNTHNYALFEGPSSYIRPSYNSESRGSGIFKALGSMVGHSILQDGNGFPFLSKMCYWYIASGEEKALQFASLDDVGQDSANIVSKVFFCCLQCTLYYMQLLSTDREGIAELLQEEYVTVLA